MTGTPAVSRTEKRVLVRNDTLFIQQPYFDYHGEPVIHVVPFWKSILRLPYKNDAKIAKIFNLWTFWPLIQLIKWFIVRFLKDGLLAKLQVKMSIGCRFLLFWQHSYKVTLSLHGLSFFIFFSFHEKKSGAKTAPPLEPKRLH